MRVVGSARDGVFERERNLASHTASVGHQQLIVPFRYSSDRYVKPSLPQTYFVDLNWTLSCLYNVMDVGIPAWTEYLASE
jgi:hypothetical protein